MKSIKYLATWIIGMSAASIPALAWAQSPALTQIKNVNDLSSRLASIGNVVVYLLVALAIVYIVWAVVQYMIKGQTGDESRRAAGMHILWGIVGLALIISIWGLVNVILGTFGTNTAAPTNRFPQVNFTSSNQSNSAPSTLFSVPPGFGNAVQGQS